MEKMHRLEAAASRRKYGNRVKPTTGGLIISTCYYVVLIQIPIGRIWFVGLKLDVHGTVKSLYTHTYIIYTSKLELELVIRGTVKSLSIYI